MSLAFLGFCVVQKFPPACHSLSFPPWLIFSLRIKLRMMNSSDIINDFMELRGPPALDVLLEYMGFIKMSTYDMNNEGDFVLVDHWAAPPVQHEDEGFWDWPMVFDNSIAAAAHAFRKRTLFDDARDVALMYADDGICRDLTYFIEKRTLV